jgi:hypothetical protein
MSRPSSWQWAVLPSLIALAIAGCSSGNKSSLALSASTTSPAADSDGGGLPDAGAVADGGIDLCGQLLVNRVRLVVRSIDLERNASAADAGSDGGTSDGGDGGTDGGDAGVHVCECPDGGTVCVKPGGDVHIGPFLVDVQGGDLADGIHQVFDLEIPQGTYDDVRFVINTLGRHQAVADGGADGGLAEMKDLHASIAVNGVFGGSPFLFKTAMRVQQRQRGPFEVGDGTKNIVLVVDPHGWFVGEHGQVLDPTDPTNRGTIKANIRCSVRMSSVEKGDGGRSFRREFEDDDRDDRCREDDDGEEDHDGRGWHRQDREEGHGGDHDGDDDHHRHPKTCGSNAPLVCGDAGSPDGGPDAGTDGG